MEARAETRRGGVLWLAYAFAARHLLGLMVPGLPVFLPIGLLAALALASVVDGAAAVVNGGFQLIGTPGTPVLVWSGAVLVVSAVIARLYLHRLVIKGTIAEFHEVVDGLPESAPRPPRPVPVLATLLLPSLLYGGAVLVNPLGWLEVSQTAVTENWVVNPGHEESAEDGRPKPRLGWSDLQALHAGQGGRMVMLMDHLAEARLLTCADSRCAGTRFSWAEPVNVDHEPAAASARLPDGRIVVTTWAVDEDARELDENWRARLGLLICDAMACAPAPGGKPITEVTWATRNRMAALAARPGGGLLVAQLHELPLEDNDVDREVLLITTCDDPACTRPRTKEVAKLPADTFVLDRHGLLAGVGPDDRPVLVRVDRETGTIYVISCDDPACVQARMGRPVRSGAPESSAGRPEGAETAMVIRPDGRPLIAYRDSADGAIKLLDCRTRECSQAGRATLSEPGHDHGALAMVLDRGGRALVAFRDLDRERIVVAACTGTRCTPTPVTTSQGDAGQVLAMALDGHGRPVIAWTGFDGSDGWELFVTTPLNLP
ncbi:hypothetical protein ETD86_47610 [Nonomuraea turkmeniaca]|uniref:Uncharacterized protein n=1 Tax=Nonomuraea turkmeniaca TaxID=103838 RepID=A0A5S4EXX8_9ACTN|nr:hypothetical protein [Nonomuraea turkmeniaca]TMR08482.1 hypothetical protein ETD86_47610 [Nonomuraea turkmeniaca]